MTEEKRQKELQKIDIAVLFSNEPMEKEIEALNKIRPQRVFAVINNMTEGQHINLENKILYSYKTIDLAIIPKKDLREQAIRDIIIALTMRGNPQRVVHLIPGTISDGEIVDLESLKELFEKYNTEVKIIVV